MMAVSGIDNNATQKQWINSINGVEESGTRKISYNKDEGSKIEDEGDTRLFNQDDGALGKMDFLNLLTTQLKYQDPLSPQENEEFVAQLAQFSQLESSQNSESSITDMANALGEFVGTQNQATQSVANASATSMIGKMAVVEVDKDYYGGSNDPIKVHLNSPGETFISILDEAGNEVHYSQIDRIDTQSEAEVPWPELNKDGEAMKSGNYSFEIKKSKNGPADAGYVYNKETVTGVNYASGGAEILLGSSSYKLSDIKQVTN
jgi:flagellar basal-body rod modification protein FlgD